MEASDAAEAQAGRIRYFFDGTLVSPQLQMFTPEANILHRSVCLTSIIRLYYAISLAQSDDVTYNITLMGFWTYAELSVGIVCGCLPIFPKFLQTFGKKLAAMNGYGASIRTLLKKSIPGRRSTKGSQTSDKTRIWEDPYAIRLESFGGNIKTDARTRQRNDISYEHV